MSRIVSYINADVVCPSGYYRICQYFRDEPTFTTHTLMPQWVFGRWHSMSARLHSLFAPIVYIVIVCRTTFHLLQDLVAMMFGQHRVVIVQRMTCPRHLPLLTAWLLKQVAKKADRLIWDFDDNIIGSGAMSKKEQDILSLYADSIVVTSEFLRDYVPEPHRHKVVLMPTTDGDMVNHDCQQLLDKRLADFDNSLNIIWVGTGSGNMGYVRRIVPALDEAAGEMKHYGRKLTLTVVSNITLDLPVEHLVVRNIAWTHDRCIEEILKAHIGIMPLQSNIYTLGKGGFKLIQYLSASLPVMASNVGYNERVVVPEVGVLLNDEDDLSGWNPSLYPSFTDKQQYALTSRAAFERYQTFFSYDANRAKWMEMVKNVNQ